LAAHDERARELSRPLPTSREGDKSEGSSRIDERLHQVNRKSLGRGWQIFGAIRADVLSESPRRVFVPKRAVVQRHEPAWLQQSGAGMNRRSLLGSLLAAITAPFVPVAVKAGGFGNRTVAEMGPAIADLFAA
jgi:hypothetical protein